jgi:hypothetical protein
MIRSQAKKAQLEANRLARRVKVGVDRMKAAVSKGTPQIKAA